MRRRHVQVAFAALFAGLAFTVAGELSFAQRLPNPATRAPKSMPEVIVLAKGSKAGQVTFNHTKHNGGEYSSGGPIACVECHHTAQPASELAKLPPLKTSWPVGRTTTLTSELFAADPVKAGAASCRDCHASKGKKPRLLPQTPSLTDPETRHTTKLTSETAFHQRCDTCHSQILFRSSDSGAPNISKCITCHKK